MNPPHASADPHPDPGAALTFSFEGQTIAAAPGQSIAAALYAAGVRIFTRSFKYHRPRGLFCVSGDCPNCLMQVDGRTNVRTCIEPAQQGQQVCHQNAWPGLGFDLLHVFDRLDFMLPVGFYYKRFHKPRWLWPIFEHTVRHIAGLGKIDVHALPHVDAEVEHLHAEVCVIGGGPAGLAAAGAARNAGAQVLLLDRQTQLGGHLLDQGQTSDEVAKILAAGANGQGNLLSIHATAFGLYEGNLIGAFQGDKLLKIRAKQIIVCTGGRQQPFLFRNNDLPGIMLGNGVLRLAHQYGVKAGKRTVVLTDIEGGSRLAEQLAGMGIEVAAVIDLRPAGQGSVPTANRWPLLRSHGITAALGRRHLHAVQVARVDEKGVVDRRPVQEIPCDLLCLVSQLAPANELLYQGGMRFRFENGRWLPARTVPGLLAAGAAAGTCDLQAQIREGRRRGLEAAAALGYAVPELPELPSVPGAASAPLPFPSRSAAGKSFVCLCEDVTIKDIDQAIAEGFDGIETLKRYSTVNMGPCQGKMCGATASALCARFTNRDLGSVGTTTSRPPVVPVELAVLAAEQRHHPIRRTPLHHWHQAAGAQWLDAGLWKRPESYGDPEAEVRAVRTGVGLIDVSTLGKIELIGPDAVQLLERVYLNKWSDLKVGRSRYGAMCTEEGILFDDGVATRLGPEHFYLTATTGNAEAVFQWLELWKATWRLNVTLLNQTSAMAAMNLAGPKSRDVLGRLTTLDVSPQGFPYQAMREGAVAGVKCRLLRIGFVGELGYEIHCPSSHAWHLWEALIQGGAEFGLKPFGVEAQRVLRLEKGHLIIGVDSDALSNPLDAGLEWMVRFDKPMFHGRDFLLRLKAMKSHARLVGFQMLDSKRIPSEGCQVVEQGRPVGRVTSSRYSPTLERSIGLAWVPTTRAVVGERFWIRWNDGDVPAVVARLPFYDPDGKQLRS